MTTNLDDLLQTGRSWRDLPPAPPVGPVPPPGPLPPPSPPPPSPQQAPTRRWRPVVAGIVLAAAAVAALALWRPWTSESQAAAAPPATVPVPDPTSPTSALPLPPVPEPAADVAEILLPALVHIETPTRDASGFVFDSEGLIFTAAHVVEGLDAVEVQLADGRFSSAEVLGADPDSNVAVLRVPFSGMAAAPLAQDGRPEVGQLAVALGSPFGLQQTVTAGVVSGLNRELTLAGRLLTGLIQTDAPINQGSSGGPLADRQGRVIGINVAIASQSGGNDGVGFAVPIERALAVAQQLGVEVED